ncbi:MAG: hypothetical protein LBE12_15680 [Planctomycetaceae bacterium]|nr:hypothetical protein [Planctomycetaceae bacterium]
MPIGNFAPIFGWQPDSPNRSATQIIVPKQGQIGYCRRDISAKHHLPRDNSPEQ